MLRTCLETEQTLEKVHASTNLLRQSVTLMNIGNWKFRKSLYCQLGWVRRNLFPMVHSLPTSLPVGWWPPTCRSYFFSGCAPISNEGTRRFELITAETCCCDQLRTARVDNVDWEDFEITVNLVFRIYACELKSCGTLASSCVFHWHGITNGEC